VVPGLAIGAYTPGYERWFNKLQYTPEGILYEDAQIQIGVKSEFHGHLGRIALYFGNKTQAPLTKFMSQTVAIPELSIMAPQPLADSINPVTQIQQLFNIECNDFFTDAPALRVSFTSSTSGISILVLKLPVVLAKFQEPITTMDGTNFFQRWKQIGGPPREAQVVFKSAVPINLPFINTMLSGYRFGLLASVDPISSNFVGAGVVDAGKAGKVGSLLRLEPNFDQQMYRLTVRTTSEQVSLQLCSLLERALTYETA
jgi:AP-2 complex subunit alpha